MVSPITFLMRQPFWHACYASKKSPEMTRCITFYFFFLSSLGHGSKINKIFGRVTMKNLTKGTIILAVTISLLFVCLAIFAQIMSPGAGNGGSGGTNTYSGYNYLPPDYGTNLWLSISLSNNAVDLLLHNTQPGVAYLIRSREDLVSGAWFSEGTVTGAIAATTTPAIINIGERTQNLFIQALAWPTSNGTAETTLMLAIGGERIMELTTNGDVVSWGGNHRGEFGDYTHLDSTNPVHVVGLTNITNIALGLNYSLAIDSNGTLWSWGQLDNGQDETNVPTQVLGMTNIIAIAAYGQEGGGDPAVAVRADGTVWMWGMSGCDTYGFPPVQIAGLSNVVSVTAGNCQTFALMTNGTVYMWGNGNEVPAPVSGLSNIVAICAGDIHTLALASNGIVWAWGYNDYGQLGDGGAENYSAVPVMVVGLTNVIAIAVGANHSLALDGGGQLWAWGDDEYEQLGDGGVAYGVNLPMQVVGMTNIISIAAGTDASVAVDGNGNLWQWGQGIDWPYSPYQEWGDENGYPRLSPTYVDFYNGQLPNLTILNGNNQTPHADLEFPQPLVFQVTDTNGVALSNAPVSVEVIAGDMELRTVSGGNNYKGLRLTTDVNGEVSLIGYADRYWINPNCLVRVLAASRQQIVEADFNETLVPLPTISITSPANGDTYLVGTNQTLTITVDAEAAPGASIQEVDYSYQINGGGNTPLGVSTRSPFSFVWTNALWTNAFVGQYTLSAAAVDNAGAYSDPQSVIFTVALDSDGNGLPDYWEIEYFGTNGLDPNSSPDGNGQTLLYDYQNGIDPNDYYDGNPPNLQIVNVDNLVETNQLGLAGSFLPVPLTVLVTDANAMLLTNAPVTFTVALGNIQFATATNNTIATNLNLRTDSNGLASVWIYFPPEACFINNTVAVQADSTITNVIIASDLDGNGLPDYWEIEYFGTNSLDPNSSPDGNGQTLLYDYQNGIDPTDYYSGNLPNLVIMSGNDQAGNYDSFLPQPIIIKVANTNFVALSNAPIVFTVTNGTALLATTTNDTPASTLTLRTDSNGLASAWVYFPPANANPPDSTILVSAFSGMNSTSIIVNEYVPLGHWTFNDTNTWIGEEGQLPCLVTNVVGIPDWSSNAVLVDSSSPALISYNVVETNGHTNINCQTGSVLFWFRPDWNSGSGPGNAATLIEIGSCNPAFTNGLWSLYTMYDGTLLFFAASTERGSFGSLLLDPGISLYSNEWYQIALTYSSTESALYIDGQLLLQLPNGVTYFTNADELTNGFRISIGSDLNGNNQAGGTFDEFRTFDYPLDANHIVTCSSEIPDWWELKYFGVTGLDPTALSSSSGHSFLYDYNHGTDPNVINFSLSVTNLFVNSTTEPVKINNLTGVPSALAVVALKTTNFVVTPTLPFDSNSNLADAVWVPYNSNIVVSLNSGDGSYLIWVGLRNPAPEDHPTWQSIKFTLDTVPPLLTITNPAAGIVSKSVIQLQGYANESLNRLTYDVSNAAGIWTNRTGYTTEQFYDTNLLTFTTNYFQCYNVAVVNGLNVIALHATDLAGNSTTTNFSFTFDASTDTNPPALTVLWPPNGTYISGSNFVLQAQVDDPMTTIAASIVDANGDTNAVQGSVEQSGLAWIQNVPIASGTNILTVTATDLAGNTSVTNLTLFQSPVTVTVNPLAADQQNQLSVTVTGTVSDPSYTLTVNGVTATVNPDGTWGADNVPVSSSGTAVFDVEVYVGDPVGVGSQLSALALPVRVGLMSYSENSSGQSVDYDYYAIMLWNLGTGQYLEPYPPGSPSFENGENDVYWTYQSGGFAHGYTFDSGRESMSFPPAVYDWGASYSWAYSIPAGDDAFSAQGEISSDIYSRVMIEPQGQTAAGTIVTYLVEAQASGILPQSMQIQGQTLTVVTNSDGSVWGQTLISALAGVNVDVTPWAPGIYTFTVQAYSLDRVMAVDNNRDGQITFDNNDATSPQQPFRFWINDSYENGDDESGLNAGADDQIPGNSHPNYATPYIQGRSDLVNFFPVAFNLSSVFQKFPLTTCEYHLSQADNAVKIVYTGLTPGNAFDYLTNTTATDGYGVNFDEAPQSADTIQVTNSGIVLDANWLTQVQDNNGQGVILVEGCATTANPLVLEIWTNGQEVAEMSSYLSLSGVEQMFRHANFSYVNGTVTVPARASAPNEPPTNGKNLVFVHGYNVNQQEARGVESEMFKRFYWSGSEANFYGVTWNGAESKGTFPFENLFTPNYHTNVVNAVETASHFATFLDNLSGQTVVVAHSLGNMVVLSAISDYDAAPSEYFMLDAAIPMEAIQGAMSYNPKMLYSTWNPYANRTFASDWWQLFPTSDARSTLTWSNRVGNLQNVDVYNFYSSGEEVLREYDYDMPSAVTDAVGTEALNAWDGYPFGTYAWVWQEKGKGTCYQDWFVGSSHGGWRFPVNEYGDPNPVPPSTANSLPDSTLQQTPIFDFGSYFDSVNGPFPDLALTNIDGSTYAQANRDRILSDAIPALTLPVGANSVTYLDDRAGDKRNFNMRNEFETSWPSARSTGSEAFYWYHSDFDYVAYPFTHKLFDEIVNDGNLK
jgi:alpha-tubulin suppressor-like RCC1 family protein